MATVLCLDPEAAVAEALENALQGIGYRILHHATLGEGLEALERDQVDLVVSSHELPDGSGIQLLGRMREQGLDLPVIVTSPYSSIEEAVASMRHGAVDYVTKPLRAEAARLAVTNAIELDRMRRLNHDYRSALTRLRGTRVMVGHGPAFAQAMRVIENVAPTKATVLVEGESGTGKELFARAIHEKSPRAEGPFVTVNCAALPAELVESTLFGHERGAFTGATARSDGAFQRAHQGTLLLDEISEMRLDLQPKLLRAIQEQEFERVGGHQPVQVDVRIVATTNRDLHTEVEAGRFRRDLYFRLHVVPLRAPALRERVEDIPDLVQHFIAKVAGEVGVKPPSITPEALATLARRPWWGNIRELANAVERAVILNRGRLLTNKTFPPLPEPGPAFQGAAPTAPPSTQDRGSDPVETPLNLRELERIAIGRALAATNGRRNRAAQLLGISDRTLRNKLKQ